ncbi:uncharacterized protein G2W53_014609 [Senna tora]|uniref:Uncharacterized protein n=1 Tax=Senna tora TaxID=362788 RepID=A0A835C6P5_9FABA|nr:uncharacterized protein G2W53_014609 [Senna tora]
MADGGVLPTKDGMAGGGVAIVVVGDGESQVGERERK